MGTRLRRLVPGFVSFVVIAAAWEAAVVVGMVNPFFTSQPSAIAASLLGQARSGALLDNTAVSLMEFGAGFGAAAAVGTSLGVLAGWSRRVEHALDPFLWFLYSAPLIAFYPVFVIWFGLGARTVVAIAFLLAAPPIMASTLSGVKRVDVQLIRAARSFGAGSLEVFARVALPASVPMVVAGLRLGVGRALTGVVIAELFGATAGLGFSIGYYGQLLQTTNMMASLVVIVAIGVLFTEVLGAIESHVDAWRTGPGV